MADDKRPDSRPNNRPNRSGGGDRRGPARDGDRRGPPRDGDRRGPPRDGDRRGPPRDGDRRGPPRDGDRRGPPRDGDRRGPPRDGDRRGPPRDGERRGPPRDGDRRGPPRDGERRGPPRDGERRGPPRDGDRRGPPRGGRDSGPRDNNDRPKGLGPRGQVMRAGANRPAPRRDPLESLPKLFVAIDTADTQIARRTIEQVTGAGAGVKIGLEFFSKFGINGTRKIVGDAPLFLDLKFHDIPNTVAGAIRAVRELNPEIVNVHAAGGLAMMKAAKEAAHPKTKVIAVTVLTSLDSNDLVSVGQQSDAQKQALRLAKLAATAGLDGVVCSPHEAQAIADATSPEFMRITPGIRVAITSGNGNLDDQKRVMSPSEAFKAGSTHLVMGRMVTRAPDPAAVVRMVMG